MGYVRYLRINEIISKGCCICWKLLYIQPIHESSINTHVELVREFHMKLHIISKFEVDHRPSVFNFLEFLPDNYVEDLYLNDNSTISAEDAVLSAFYNSRICDDHAIFKNEQIFQHGHPFDPVFSTGSPQTMTSLSIPSTPLRNQHY